MFKYCWSEHRQEITLCWSENTLHKDLTDTVGCLNVSQNCLYEKSRSESGLPQINYRKPNLFFWVLFSPPSPPPPAPMVGQVHLAVDDLVLFHSHKCSQKCCEKITVKVRTSNMEFVCSQGVLRGEKTLLKDAYNGKNVYVLQTMKTCQVTLSHCSLLFKEFCNYRLIFSSWNTY